MIIIIIWYCHVIYLPFDTVLDGFSNRQCKSSNQSSDFCATNLYKNKIYLFPFLHPFLVLLQSNRGFLTIMVYLYNDIVSRYTILVGNPRNGKTIEITFTFHHGTSENIVYMFITRFTDCRKHRHFHVHTDKNVSHYLSALPCTHKHT